MAIRKYVARDFDFSFRNDTGDTWSTISGIAEWSFTIDTTTEDTSTIDSGAWGSTMPTQKTGSLELNGFYLVDGDTGTRDSGQSKVELKAMQVGYAAYGIVRVRQINASGVELGNFYANCLPQLNDMGGASTAVAPLTLAA